MFHHHTQPRGAAFFVTGCLNNTSQHGYVVILGADRRVFHLHTAQTKTTAKTRNKLVGQGCKKDHSYSSSVRSKILDPQSVWSKLLSWPWNLYLNSCSFIYWQIVCLEKAATVITLSQKGKHGWNEKQWDVTMYIFIYLFLFSDTFWTGHL